MLAYVENYSGTFNPNAEQIVYLNDLGVTEAVITAMVKHNGSTAPAAPTPPPAVIQTQAAPGTAAPVHPSTPPSTPPSAPPETTPPPSTEVTYFYDSLAPYGSWVYLSGYGWCWQPTVSVTVAGWRPYTDRGRWYWSDSGWYWHSEYSWGWAPFHYGRWYHHAHSGWVWTPGTVWGPAWVSWRYTDGYCGWAPLPPEAHWVSGVGFTYYGRHVSVGFEFGLLPFHYAFISAGRFCDPHPYRHIHHHHQHRDYFDRSKVANNYTPQRDHLVNHGVGRDLIKRQSQTEIHEVKVQPSKLTGTGPISAHVEKKGNDLVVHRPNLPKDPPVKPATIANRMAENLKQAHAKPMTPTAPMSPRVTPHKDQPGSSTPPRHEPQASKPAMGQDQPKSPHPVAKPHPDRIESRPAQPQAQPQPPSNIQEKSRPATPQPTTRGNVEKPSKTAPADPALTPTSGVPPSDPTPMRRVYPEPRTPEPRTPVTPRPSTPTVRDIPRNAAPATMTPRYQEQQKSAPHASAPATPSAPPKAAPNPSPSRSTPTEGGRSSSGGGGRNVEGKDKR